MNDSHAFVNILATLIAIILATKLLGALAQRLGQPSVLGELLAGVLLGGSVLGIIDPQGPVVFALAELGVLILLFEIGLHTELGSLVRVGGTAASVGVVGVILPFAGGYVAAVLLGLETLPAIVCGAALTATSVGISARVLSDLGQLDRTEGRIVLGAAVIDDVIGLIILSLVTGLAAGVAPAPLPILKTAALAFGFIAAAIVIGRTLVPTIFGWIARIEIAGTLGLFGLAFAFVLAWLAEHAGSAMIIGAFAAGLILNPTPQRRTIERATTEIGHFFVPVFFAAVGAAVDIRSFLDPATLAIGGALIVVGIAGKMAAGFAPWWFKGNKALIGAAMIPRGEVGLIFAQMGLATGAIDVALFSAIALMVMVTTFAGPPLLQHFAARDAIPSEVDRPGQGGVDDLVAGEYGRRKR
ncbi:MAG: cation:proton antiporter [Gemmatimonadaceae bacterium]|nr:cation:proton antiporter [Gemmatimonadaceae bacterium]